MAAPVKYTCPDIDRAIDYLEDVKRLIDTSIRYFEELRSANQALREWGEGLENELEEAANTINNLEAELNK